MQEIDLIGKGKVLKAIIVQHVSEIDGVPTEGKAFKISWHLENEEEFQDLLDDLNQNIDRIAFIEDDYEDD